MVATVSKSNVLCSVRCLGQPGWRCAQRSCIIMYSYRIVTVLLQYSYNMFAAFLHFHMHTVMPGGLQSLRPRLVGVMPWAATTW